LFLRTLQGFCLQGLCPDFASTKPHVHQKFENFGTNIASTMACPNFKNGPKTGLHLLGIKLFLVALSLMCYDIAINDHGATSKVLDILSQKPMSYC
jgi:hypothetical protein